MTTLNRDLPDSAAQQGPRVGWLAWLVMACGLVASLVAGMQVKHSIEAEVAQRLGFTYDQATLKIRERLDAYALTLRGGAALFAASEQVSRQEWRAYVETLQSDKTLPGVQGIGFAKVIAPGQLESHIKSIRREGYANYTVRPPGQRDTTTSIVYLEPFRDRNLRAFGYDMYSEPVRRAAMEHARDTGAAALSGKVELVQETGRDVQAGTLMYVPVYRNGAVVDTVAGRQAALLGWVYSPYRMNDLMSGILQQWEQDEGGAIDLHIYDGMKAQPGALLFDNVAAVVPGAGDLFYQNRSVDLNGHTWLLEFAYSGKLHYAPAWASLLGGLALTAVLFGLMLSQRNTRFNARRIAQELTQALTAQQQRLANILEGTHAGTWEWNVQSGATVFNPRWAEIVGYTLDELAPVSIDTWSRLVHPDDLTLSGDLLAKHFAGELPYYECEARMRHKDGHWVWVLDRGSVVTWAEPGKPLLVSGTHQDISVRKSNDALLQLAREQADAANQAKSRFLATMSHEIRTPMNGVLGMAQMLLTAGLGEAERREYARTILSSGQALLALLNDILDLSKIEAGKLALESNVFAPEALLQDTRNLFAVEAQAKGLFLNCQWLGAAGQRYQADAYRLHQMLSNLVSNAIKFTPRGSIRLEAKELERRPGPVALIEFAVYDSGIGIAPDQIDLLFKPFSQADGSTTREYGGTGLGLSIVRQLAIAMGGDVGVQSEVGAGSKFWFRVWVTVEVDSVDASVTERAVPGLLRGHVLVVEDNPVNALVVQAQLRALGLTMSRVTDGQQAVDGILQGSPMQRPDVVLMDLQMPVLNGDAATRRIRQWEVDTGQQRLPIIAVTADVFAENRKNCLNAGMDDFLSKPVSLESLRAALARWLAVAPPSQSPAMIALAAKPLDAAAFADLVGEIIPLLEQNKFDAIRRYYALQALVAGTALAGPVDAMAAPLKDMRFDMVLGQLQSLRADPYAQSDES